MNLNRSRLDRRHFLASSACLLLTLAGLRDGTLKAAPQTIRSEPTVRIGIVLAQDRKSNIDFMPLGDDFTVVSTPGGESQRLSAGAWLNVTLSDGRLRLNGAGSRSSQTECLRLAPPGGPLLDAPGVLIRNVVAGRQFHWHQAVDQIFGGTLEFRVHGSNVIAINEIPLEQYLLGVLTSEMSGDCPVEYIKAQSVVARSWLLSSADRRHRGEDFDVCNDDHCQRYQGRAGKTDRAVAALAKTRGEILLTHSGDICQTVYSKNSGGITEDPEIVWGGAIPGLRSRYDGPPLAPEAKFFPVTERNVHEYIAGDWLPEGRAYAHPNVISSGELRTYLGRVDTGLSHYRWRVRATHDELRTSLVTRGGLRDLDLVLNIVPGQRGVSGRLKEAFVSYLVMSGAEKWARIGRELKLRKALHADTLFSSAFVVDLTRNHRSVVQSATFYGAGWGHGVGLCQIGSLGRALSGQRYQDILYAYFDKVALKRLYI